MFDQNVVIDLIGRTNKLFKDDLETYGNELNTLVNQSAFLIIGAAGSIGQSVVKEIFKRRPKLLHVVDISENNLAELVRDLRSSFGYIHGEFRTLVLDFGDKEFRRFMRDNRGYNYVFNLAALKHVRSEKDPYTLARMVKVNILNTLYTYKLCDELRVDKYFVVSSDKAANPANMMGASKLLMEEFMMQQQYSTSISSARFANVAFSDGSLLHSFNQRILKRQPIAAPKDVRRYFVTHEEAGELCLMSGLLGCHKEIFFPQLDENLHLKTFSEIASNYLELRGFKIRLCGSEQEARDRAHLDFENNTCPVYFFDSDTTGEKPFEEFTVGSEELDMKRFSEIGVIKNTPKPFSRPYEDFLEQFKIIMDLETIKKSHFVDLFDLFITEFKHQETGKYLDEKM